jgi:hypothetical protein
MFFWSSGLNSRGNNDSTRRWNSKSTDLEIKAANKPVGIFHDSELTSKERVPELVKMMNPDHHGESGLLLHSKWKNMFGIPGIL